MSTRTSPRTVRRDYGSRRAEACPKAPSPVCRRCCSAVVCASRKRFASHKPTAAAAQRIRLRVVAGSWACSRPTRRGRTTSSPWRPRQLVRCAMSARPLNRLGDWLRIEQTDRSSHSTRHAHLPTRTVVGWGTGPGVATLSIKAPMRKQAAWLDSPSLNTGRREVVISESCEASPGMTPSRPMSLRRPIHRGFPSDRARTRQSCRRADTRGGGLRSSAVEFPQARAPDRQGDGRGLCAREMVAGGGSRRP